MGAVARGLLLPSIGLVVVSGLFSMAATPAYGNAGWVWLKLASAILVLEGTLVSVQGPMERAARNARAALAGELDPTTLGETLRPEWLSLWVILAVGIANVVVGVWRPRFSSRGAEAPE